MKKKSKYGTEKITVKLSNSRKRKLQNTINQRSMGIENEKWRREEGRVDKAKMMIFLIIDLDYL